MVWWWRQWRWKRGKGLFPKEELEVVYNASTPLILIDWSSATTSNICPTIYWWRDIHERHTRVISLAFAFRSCLSIYGNTGTGLLWTYLISFIFLHNVIWDQEMLNLKVRWFATKFVLRQNCVQNVTLCVTFYNQRLWWSWQISSVPLDWVSFSLLPLYTTVKAHMSLFVSFLVWNFSSCNKV